MRNSKITNSLYLILVYLVLLLGISCSDPTLNNPFDPEVNTDFPAPTLISVDNFGLAKIQVKFSSDYEYFTKYQLERKTEQTGFLQIAIIPAEIIAFQAYVDSLINADSLYTYRIRGMADELPGPYSNTMSHTLSITPPVDILAYSPDDHRITIEWNMSKSREKQMREGYEFGTAIERKINNDDYAELIRLDSYLTTFTDSALSVNINYTYRLRTYLNQSHSSYCTPFTMQTQIVNTPSQLTAEPLSDQQIELSWQDNCAFETGYSIERKEDEGNFSVIGEVNENVTSYTDEGLLLYINYTYRVQAFTDYNVSEYSNEAGTSTFFPAPYNLTAEAVSDQNIVLEWEYSLPVDNKYIWITNSDKTYRKIEWDDNRFQQGFSIFRREEAGSFEEVGTTAADIFTFTDQDLLLGINYQYYVVAFTDLNISDGSNMVWEQTFFPAPDGLEAIAVNDQSIELSWQDNCAFETGYRIERKEDTGDFIVIGEVGENVTTYIDEGLTLSMNYTYRIQAFTIWNVSDYSNEEMITLIMPAPTNLTSDPLNDQEIILSWDDNSSFEEGFVIERSDNYGTFDEIVSLLENETEYTDQGLNFGSDYTYRVRAFSSQYYSDYSNESTTQTVFPPPVNLLSTLISDTSIQIDWDDNCSFEDGYFIERRDAGSSYVQIASVPPNNITYTDIDLDYGFEYTYRVQAFTSLNVSIYTNEATQLVEIAAPSDLVAAAGSISITLDWIDNSEIEENVEIERKITGEDFQLIATVNGNIETYEDTSVVTLTTYFYRVRAITLNNQSDYSNIANATIAGE